MSADEHDPRNGRRSSDHDVSERDFFERILGERRRAHDEQHNAHDSKHIAEQQLLEFARRTLEARVDAAAANVEERDTVVASRLDKLESGGAPFASRLDESLKTLKQDVEDLKTRSVEQAALDGLRLQNTEAIAAQKRQIKYILVAAGLSLALALILVGIRLATGIST
jgi:hypothetical protein